MQKATGWKELSPRERSHAPSVCVDSRTRTSLEVAVFIRSQPERRP
jgi:hypothetical protein